MIDDVLSRLAALPPSPDRDAFIAFVTEGGDAALRRDGGPEHVTASCFVFSPDLTRVLLCFHRKGQFWVQFGGHLEESDATVAAAALREAVEESGIEDLALLADAILDLDRHELHGGFTCRAHWDVRFAALADEHAPLAVSDESEELRWFPVDDLPVNVATGLPDKLAQVRKLAATLAA